MANLCSTYCFVYKVVCLSSRNFALNIKQHHWLPVLFNEKSHLDSISSNFSLSFEYRIETVVRVDQMENRKYSSEIAKLKRDTFGQNLVADLHLRITNTTNNKSSKEGCLSLWNTKGNPWTKFVTELLEDPCLKSPENWNIFILPVS